ncbi:YheC/YheD family protein [Mangrovibacillus sp. Mu-81]|jgi:hypothetical protein|uniref:YheC/YheD family endospore coat-associated protein n=1 Tax=Mangrovibacillus sp. Mu-81 TaxID=3121478 RepID=UPI002FE46C1F
MHYSLGIMTLNPDLSNPYFNGIGKQSISNTNDLYLFSPRDISPVNETVEGYAFNREAGNWVKEIFDIPGFIYDRTYYDKSLQSRQAKAVVQWMKNQPHIHFLGYGLPNKWLMYEKLKNSTLSSYIPETFLLKNHLHLFNLLIKHKDIIIKPVDGANGFAVYHLILSNSKVTVRTTKNHQITQQSFPSKSIFLNWAERMLEQHIFIAQERIDNRTELDTPFDIRILLNKDQFGDWREFQRAIREGTKGGIVTNISRGASYFSQEDWESIHPEADWAFVGNELNAILNELPALLEDYFSPLFEIGVDIVLAKDGSLWILDINSKPGHKIVDTLGTGKLESLHRTPLEYCEHLYSKSIPSLRRGDF